jgi:hypothetical protein
MAGDVFEVYCHVIFIFSTTIELHFLPMVCVLGGQPKAKERVSPRWHSSHTEFKGSERSTVLEVLRAGMDPSHVIDYSPSEVAGGLHIKAEVYYIPIKTTQVGIDSFILHDNDLYLLQMTASDTHVISDKLLPFLTPLKGLPPKHSWHFIFVKPPCQILACPILSSAEL